jgi:hypothetical protein
MLKKEGVLCCVSQRSRQNSRTPPVGSKRSGKKTGFLSHLYIKVIFLPRQARDKHRENSKKARFFRRGQPPYAPRLALPATASASAGGGEAQQRAQVEVGGGATGEERFTTPWFCLEFNFLVEE